jgi:hypothetical protein
VEEQVIDFSRGCRLSDRGFSLYAPMSLGLHYHPKCSLEHDPFSAVHDCLFSKDKDTTEASVLLRLDGASLSKRVQTFERKVAVSSLRVDVSKKTLKSRLPGQEVYRL